MGLDQENGKGAVVEHAVESEVPENITEGKKQMHRNEMLSGLNASSKTSLIQR